MKSLFTFQLYENVRASFEIVDKEVRNVKIISKVPRGQLNSFLNDAGLEAEKMCDFINRVVTFSHGGNVEIIETDDFTDGVAHAYKFINLNGSYRA